MQDYEHDEVEAFARQLDAVCLNTPLSWEKEDCHSEAETGETGETGALWGYTPLPQEDDDDDDEQQQQQHVMPVMPVMPVMTPPVLPAEERVSADTLALIKSIMGNVTLSESAVPAWAKVLPESIWLPSLLSAEETPE